jgi:8-oxo-dGTP pyrophosphatase MutT (NUDIX family)
MKKLLKRTIKFFRPMYWPFIKAYFRFLSPETRGVRVILTYDGEILFIKSSYGLKYTFPGGNLGKHENAMAGGIREVKEEIGIELQSLNFLGTLIPPIEFEYRKNTISIFTAELPHRDIKINNLEISDFKWLPVANPPSMGHVACQIFELYKTCLL